MDDAEMHAVLDAVEIVDTSQPIRFIVTEERWIADAACRGMDPSVFFPNRGDPATGARETCAICPVTTACLDYALRVGEKAGVWGGLSERQRRQLRRELRMGTPARVKPINHGTANGYSQHRNQGTPPCPACRQAHTRYVLALRAARRGDAA